MSTSHSSYRQFGNQITFINELPVEILTIIFFLLPPSTFENPYVYLRLSWVCHYWRVVLLGNPAFWNIVKHKTNSSVSFDFVQETIRRSQSSKLDVFWCTCDLTFKLFGGISCLPSYTSAQCLRIRTLYLPNDLHHFLDYGLEEWPEFCFPQLESLMFPPEVHLVSYNSINGNAIKNLITKSQLRYLECPDTLFDKQMPKIILSVEWLKITSYNLDIKFLHDILQNLPTLRVLNLIMRAPRHLNVMPESTITLPNLRMFSLDLFIWRGEYRSIRAPALHSLAIFQRGSLEYHDVWECLEGINMPMIKSVSVRLSETAPRFNRKPGMAGSMGCISTGHSEEDCLSFYTFHQNLPISHAALDKHSLLPPKNSFHIELLWSENFYRLFHHLNRATDLVELTVDFQSIKADCKHTSFLIDLFRSLKTILRLTILRSSSFVLLCDLLETSMPFLERLSYHSSVWMNNPKFLPKRVKEMQEHRIHDSCRPLKVLELKNFSRSLSPQCVAEIEDLGIQLINSG